MFAISSQVLSLASAAESPRLLCLKILGDTIMVGGTHGYIGLAIVGAPARYRLEVSSSRKLSESGVCEVISRQYEGHQAEAHVLVIASDEDLSLFVSGDSLGGVALWKQRKRTGTAFIGSLKGRSLGGSRICAIEFTPQKTHLVIGTTKKLLLVGNLNSLLLSLISLQDSGALMMDPIAWKVSPNLRSTIHKCLVFIPWLSPRGATT
jgi:WD40 repeat protein